MNAMMTMLICLCGGLGAIVRFVLDTAVKRHWTHAFPMATLVINAAASFLAGLVAGLFAGFAPSDPWRLMLATGFLGGFSTFSTMMSESVTLLRSRRVSTGFANLAVQLVAPVLCAALGFTLG